MKYLPLLWRNLMRKKVRTLFTVGSILVSFLLFGLLAALEQSFLAGAEEAGVDRLITMHKVSFVQPLPLHYRQTIQAVEGVQLTCPMMWFGGYYQDRSNQFSQFAVDPEALLALTPYAGLGPEERQRWLADRTGAIVAASIARRFGWEVGDRVPLISPLFQPGGRTVWEFDIDGIFDDSDPAQAGMGQFFFHYEYLNQADWGLAGGEFNMVGHFISRISDPDRADAIAAAIDARFANSPNETKTSTERAFAQSFANQVGNVRAIAIGISLVVFFTLLLVAGNTVSQSVRERTAELAVLKTFGFTDGGVMALVIAEALTLTALGGVIGLALSLLVARAVDLQTMFGIPLYVPQERLVLGGLLILVFGLLAAALPAWQALRLRIVDALRSA